MYKYQYLILLDLDEFIIPKSDEIQSLQHLLKKINEGHKNPDIASYSFQNVFFFTAYPHDPWAAATPPGVELRMNVVTSHSKEVFPHGQRSKYIVNPRRIVEAGNHVVWTYHSGRAYKASLKEGAVHHYREYHSEKPLPPAETDRTAHKYIDPLVEKVQGALKVTAACNVP